jgi:ubiquinone/menaquinone biosynthesis C-methylase UbiE
MKANEVYDIDIQDQLLKKRAKNGGIVPYKVALNAESCLFKAN